MSTRWNYVGIETRLAERMFVGGPVRRLASSGRSRRAVERNFPGFDASAAATAELREGPVRRRGRDFRGSVDVVGALGGLRGRRLRRRARTR